MAAVGVPLVPGSDGAVPDLETARAVAGRIGYPVLIKAAAGGGGRGMKVAPRRRANWRTRSAWRAPRRAAAFGNDAVYLEKYLDRPRHIELQIMADDHGNVVHFGERDCSLQRRHQKLLEEAGSPAHHAGAARRAGRDGDGGAAQARLPQRRHAGVPVSGRAVRVHRNEHAAAGRASGDRDGLRHRPGARADPHRRRRAAGLRPERHHVQRPRHRMPDHRRGSGHLHADARAG